jgi:A/G-specific adenine glycosylase
MPWRKTTDPYAILVSEFMLQQTTVATVRPYYDRFLNKFPTLTDLAGAPLGDVLALWSGLGYYARARNLWSAMNAVQKDHAGKIPSELGSLMNLPGIGPYTAGAISTIAFNRPAPVLDGNIIRVMMRLLAIEDDPKMKVVQAVLKKAALDLSEGALGKRKPSSSMKNGPRDLSLALMDLGATICTPRAPACPECPLKAECLAFKHGKQEDIPPGEEKIERPTVRRLHAIITHAHRWLMGRRPEDGLFGGLWEFVGVDASPNTELVPYLEEAVKRETGLAIDVLEAMPAFEHQLSHRVFVVRAYLCQLRSNRPALLVKKGLKYEEFRWIHPTHVSRLGLSAITKRTINNLVLDKKKP